MLKIYTFLFMWDLLSLFRNCKKLYIIYYIILLTEKNKYLNWENMKVKNLEQTNFLHVLSGNQVNWQPFFHSMKAAVHLVYSSQSKCAEGTSGDFCRCLQEHALILLTALWMRLFLLFQLASLPLMIFICINVENPLFFPLLSGLITGSLTKDQIHHNTMVCLHLERCGKYSC